ncbi:glycerol-3-phosphate acyltransferase, partial [Staphylococcus sp.]
MMIVLMLILSYLIGAIPNGYIIRKVFFKKDIREVGSGN